MDKRTLFDKFHRVDTNISSVGEDLKEIQEKMNHLIEENATLQIENQHLRDRIEYMTKEIVPNLEESEPEMSKSRQNLQKLYEDGFHVCNVYFGTRRIHDESCVFCLDVIYGEREQQS
ncbi:DNA replication initiation control protein YabA [Jeotgalibaca sp. MA1X17-3]|uniref:initiation-control protein YabA n=1 Tax=Jeotgalibaca sp. MA1X17-3 TaxID=2908211 RepID=UPI001F475E0E|nr:DNA replication initiation control protein YabA [Jeotgalibaca sp. MA1X17-3]UJF15882.1 DNA replication initiation control protein YabA [Jeotgalibaca sp. MA1X17-3]